MRVTKCPGCGKVISGLYVYCNSICRRRGEASTSKRRRVAPWLAIVAVAVVLFAQPVSAGTIDVSGGCLDEITQEAGLAMASGECVTPAEYDEMFGFDNLSNVQWQGNDGRSVAEVYNIVPDVASKRQRSFDSARLLPFAELVWYVTDGKLIG